MKKYLIGFFLVLTLFSPSRAAVVEVRAGIYGGYIRKRILSVKELRFRRLFRQRYDLSCGSAALASLLKFYYGTNVSEEDIIRNILSHGDIKRIRSHGFSMLDLKRSAESFGFQAEGYKVPIRNLSRLKMPTIILLNSRGYKHFVILKGVKEDKVFIADPALGHRIISLDEFKRSWNGILLAVFGKRVNGKVWTLCSPGVTKEKVWTLEDVAISNLLILDQPFDIKP
ncbi:C39 family peptidase [Thermosulfurimonas sp. F29]|uniref:C39 family peptidase n=1 Tax=Thermosulfurimonas sp. F29 TaxID=2867247 RepID=UPI001C83B90E|nr:C39 family peptidase [Thermosulfurimonas sp. F29]MBX6421978.1 C39 family peptidase [Thermosulfurimonas sp. F29]